MRSYRRQNDDITIPKISVISNTPLKHKIVEELQRSVQIQKSEAMALPITLKVFSIYAFSHLILIPTPPQFSHRIWKNYKGHLFQHWGGNRPSLPPCWCHCVTRVTRAERPMHTILNYNQVFYFKRRKYQLLLCVVYQFTCAGCNSVYIGETTLMFQF